MELIQCSAGIGRTGTFLAIHINKEKALLKEPIDIMKTVMNLVSNFQYFVIEIAASTHRNGAIIRPIFFCLCNCERLAH